MLWSVIITGMSMCVRCRRMEQALNQLTDDENSLSACIAVGRQPPKLGTYIPIHTYIQFHC